MAYTLQPIDFFLGRRGTSSYVPLCSRAYVSTIMICGKQMNNTKGIYDDNSKL